MLIFAVEKHEAGALWSVTHTLKCVISQHSGVFLSRVTHSCVFSILLLQLRGQFDILIHQLENSHNNHDLANQLTSCLEK